MHAHEARRIELRLERAQPLALQVRVLAEMQPHVIPVRLRPIQLRGLAEDDLAGRGADGKALEMLRAFAQRADQLRDARITPAGRPARQLRPRAIDGPGKAIGVKRLEQIIQRVHLEGAQRVLIERRHEHHHRRRVRVELLQHREAVAARHLHVEKENVGPHAAHGGDRLGAALAAGHHLAIALRAQQRFHPRPGQGLVIGNHNAEAAGHVSISTDS